MSQFHRKTEGGIATINPDGINIFRHDHAITQLLKKSVEQWEKGVDQKRAIKAHRGPGVGRVGRGKIAENPALALHHQVHSGGIYLAPMQNVVVEIADAAKRVTFAVDHDSGDLTAPIAILAPAALEGVAIRHFSGGQLIKVEAGWRQHVLLEAAIHLQGYSEGPHQARVWWHYHFLAGKGGHGCRDRFVVADATLNENLVADRAITFDPVGVIQTD